MNVAEFYSPVSFLRILLKVNRNHPFTVIQMKKSDFKDFQSSSKMLRFSEVPYTKVFQLKFSKCSLHIIEYKNSHAESDFRSAMIGQTRRTRKQNTDGKFPIEVNTSVPPAIRIVSSRKQKTEKELPKNKLQDLKSMLTLMPLLDREYYRTIGVKN